MALVSSAGREEVGELPFLAEPVFKRSVASTTAVQPTVEQAYADGGLAASHAPKKASESSSLLPGRRSQEPSPIEFLAHPDSAGMSMIYTSGSQTPPDCKGVIRYGRGSVSSHPTCEAG
jgi:hypothetical protein